MQLSRLPSSTTCKDSKCSTSCNMIRRPCVAARARLESRHTVICVSSLNSQQLRARRGSRHVCCAKVRKVDQEELEVAIQNRDKPLVIDFYATWCGPCVLLAKELEQVADELGDKVEILKVDTDEQPEISSQLQIQGLPTMVFVSMDKDKPALRTEGLLAANVIKEIIDNEL